MKKIGSFFIVFLFCLSFLITQEAGTAEGTKIGNIFKAVITTALPSAQLLFNTIWPKKPNGNPVDNASKSNVANNIVDYQNKLKQSLKDQNEKIKNVLNEVSVIKSFLTPCNKIQGCLSEILIKIGGASVDQQSWDAAKGYWVLARGEISKLKADNSIDPLLRDKLNKIAQTDSNDVDRIKIEYFELSYSTINTGTYLKDLREKIYALANLYQTIPGLIVCYLDAMEIEYIKTQAAISESVERIGTPKEPSGTKFTTMGEKENEDSPEIVLIKERMKGNISDIEATITVCQEKLKKK